MIFLWRIFLSVVAVFLFWRIAALGASAHYVELLRAGDLSAAAKALIWRDRQPDAKFQEALSVMKDDQGAAGSWLREVYSENPAQARPLLLLAGVEEGRGDSELANALVTQAVALAPADAEIQYQSAAYWAARGEIETAVIHWSYALEAGRISRDRVFPELQKIAEGPGARGAFRPLLESPPSWWHAFFSEISRKADSLETVRAMYAMRRTESREPLSDKERRAYTARLIKDGQIMEAYLVWVHGLDEHEREHLGLLYNGGFEMDPTSTGFDWQFRNTERVLVSSDNTDGIKHSRALHLVFQSRRDLFHHVVQHLFLDPGTYSVTGMVKTDGVESKGGLTWAAFCRLPKWKSLDRSEVFLGSGDWREFSFEFLVPENCPAVVLQLRTVGKRSYEYWISGAIWFDGMSLRKVDGNTDSVPEDASAF